MIAVTRLVTIDGLPLHPLMVHAVVVLLPLSAVGIVLIAVRPAWRRRYGTVVAGLTVLAVAAVPVAQQSGEQLRDQLGSDNPQIAQHAALGETMLTFAIVLGVLALALVSIGWLADRRQRAAEQGTAAGAGPWRVMVVVVAVLAVLSATATTVQLVRTGHSGSKAVWEGVVPGS